MSDGGDGARYCFSLIRMKNGSWPCWAIDLHWDADRGARTALGSLVYRSKYLEDPARAGALPVLETEIRSAVRVLRDGPFPVTLRDVTAVCAVPCHPPKPFSLPHWIARVVADELGVKDRSRDVEKRHSTELAKQAPSVQYTAYGVTVPFIGEVVLLVDDLLRTGGTLESVAHHLRLAGATKVIGFCATKASKGMN